MFVRVYLLQDVGQKLDKLCVLNSRFLGAELLQQVCRGHRPSLQIPAQQEHVRELMRFSLFEISDILTVEKVSIFTS